MVGCPLAKGRYCDVSRASEPHGGCSTEIYDLIRVLDDPPVRIATFFDGALYRGHRFRGGNSVTLIVRLPEHCEETGGQGDRSSGASVGETSSARPT